MWLGQDEIGGLHFRDRMKEDLMGTAAQLLTFEQFQAQYGENNRYEYWFGEARLKGVPNWDHAFLQGLILHLFWDLGYRTGSEVELRIIPDAHPKPDVIATRSRRAIKSYPDEALDVAVEIISPDDKFPYVREKCIGYVQWGFDKVYTVDPSDRSILVWSANGASVPVEDLAGIPAARIWEALDEENKLNEGA